jgi:peptidoglycan/LPS O-acetylase OafA/YrhL
VAESVSGVRRLRHVEGLDIIRFAAALMVVFYHFAYWYWHDCKCVDANFPSLIPYSWWGWVGVPVFFVISGFVIALSAEGRSASDFFRGRLLRLAPALWFFATLSFLVLLITKEDSLPRAGLLFAKSVVLWPVGPWVDGVYWSLTVEVLFYAIIFALLASRRFDQLWAFAKVWFILTAFFAAICLLDLYWNSAENFAGALHRVRDSYASRYLLLTTGPYFVVGLTTYFIYRQGVSLARVAVLLASFCAAEVSIYFQALTMEPAERFGVSPFIPGLIFAVAMLLIAVSLVMDHESFSYAGRRFSRIIRLLGLASYSLYLVHFIAGRWILTLLLAHGLPKAPALVLTMGLCIGAAVLFVLALETRIRTWLASGYDRVAALMRGTGATPSVQLVSRRV